MPQHPTRVFTKRKDQGAKILHWWQGIEQASIELALDFNYVLHADIAECYASIYTHSVAWAVHGKTKAKADRHDQALIGNAIDGRIQDMQNGQTNGIPQGSILLDLIAELVLGYADLKLSRRLHKDKISNFQILRYRDDYRIFVNDSQVGEIILKALTEILISLGLKLNVSETTGAQAVVESSVKVDKREWMRRRQRDRNLQKHLLLIHYHGTDFPQCRELGNSPRYILQAARAAEIGTNPDATNQHCHRYRLQQSALFSRLCRNCQQAAEHAANQERQARRRRSHSKKAGTTSQ